MLFKQAMSQYKTLLGLKYVQKRDYMTTGNRADFE
jgi:hypothetical protein